MRGLQSGMPRHAAAVVEGQAVPIVFLQTWHVQPLCASPQGSSVHRFVGAGAHHP